MHALHAVSNSRARRTPPLTWCQCRTYISLHRQRTCVTNAVYVRQHQIAPSPPVIVAGRSYMVVDSTVVDPALRAAIEQQAGFALKDADPDALSFIVRRSKEAGNQAYKNRDYNGTTSHMVQVYAGLGLVPSLPARIGVYAELH